MTNLLINWWRNRQFNTALKTGNIQLAEELLETTQRVGARLSLTQRVFRDKLKSEKSLSQYEREVIVLREQISQASLTIKELSRNQQQLEQTVVDVRKLLSYKEQEIVSIQQQLEAKIKETNLLQQLLAAQAEEIQALHEQGIFANREQRRKSHQAYQEIFNASLKQNGYIIVVVQGKRLFQAYNQIQTENQAQEENLIKTFINELGLKLEWYKYMTSTGKRIPLEGAEFRRFASENLPLQKHMTRLLRQYFKPG